MKSSHSFGQPFFAVLGAALLMAFAGCGGSNTGASPSSQAASSRPSSSPPASSLSAISSRSSLSSRASSGVSSSAGAVGNANAGASQYVLLCQTCHGTKGDGLHRIDARRFDAQSLTLYIAQNMPKGSPQDCLGGCAQDTAAYILAGFMANPSSAQNSSSTAAPTAWQGAASKRLTAAMLQKSLPLLLGETAGQPIGWTLASSRQTSDAFDSLAQTLGKPDYVEVTEEVRDVTALYVKLTTDMALDTCAKAIARDYQQTTASARELVRFSDLQNIADSARIAQNLRYLKLRFHATRIAESDTASIADLQALFNSVAADDALSASNKAKAAWQTVCVALIRSPEFHIY